MISSMPELPEVESVLRTLVNARPALIGRRIEQVQVFHDGVLAGWTSAGFQGQIQGSVFTTACRLGKYLYFTLNEPEQGCNSCWYLVVHLRMTGTLTLHQDCEQPGRHTRLSLNLDQGLALRFDDPRKFGRVWLVESLAEVTSKLGPDALTVSFDQFSARIASCRRQLKPLLLDQSFVAGIGNIYADEILFRAGLHPLCNSADLSHQELSSLHGAMISVLRDAVAAGGANIDGVFKAGMFRVHVYARQGQPCYCCGELISKTRVAQRGTHFCPVCQKERSCSVSKSNNTIHG